MTSMDCGTTRETIPDVVASRATVDEVAAVEAHTATCEDCAAEMRLAAALYVGRPQLRMDLSERILATLSVRRRSTLRPWWGLSAAAVAALALGIGITSQPASDIDLADELAVESEEGELWLSDDGVLAGAPVLETLSDDALAQLLEELTSEPSGGQA
jgi:predicted anti-sigma-YlaC factor YlaD